VSWLPVGRLHGHTVSTCAYAEIAKWTDVTLYNVKSESDAGKRNWEETALSDELSCESLKRLNDRIAHHRRLTSQLPDLTCHKGSHSVTNYTTQVNTPRLNTSQASWYSIYVPWKDGRLSWLRFTRPQTVTHPSTDWAQCRTTVLIETSVRNREVLLEGSLILRRGSTHAHGPGVRILDPLWTPLASARTTLTSWKQILCQLNLLSLKFF